MLTPWKTVSCMVLYKLNGYLSLKFGDMKKTILLTACFLLCANMAYAALPGMEAGNSPAVINKQNLRQYEELQIEREFVETVPEDIEKEKKLQEQRQKREELQKETNEIKKGEILYNPQFRLNKIIFEGNTAIKDKELQRLAASLINTDVYLDNIMDLTLEVSRYYQKKGYITSYAILPPQEIEGGIVKILIVESKVGPKVSNGNKWERDYYLDNIVLGGKNLSVGKVFNARALQGAMKDINRSDYMKANVAIERDPETDETKLELNVQDRFPVSLDLGWDDFGRDYTGRQRFTAIGGIDNLTGFGDKIYGGPILSSRATGVIAGYQLPVGPYGTKLGFDYSQSHMTLGGPYRDLGIKGKSNTTSFSITQPLINNATTDFNARVSYDMVGSNTAIFNTPNPQSISNYNLNVIRAGVYGMHDDKTGRWIGSAGVDLGLSGNENMDNGPQSLFYKIVASAARVQRLPKDCLGIIRVNGQYTPQSLYAAEQMFLGGAYSIRGYQPSELIGDYGIAGSVELRTPIPFLKKALPEKFKHVSDKIKFVLFYDWGFVKEHNDLYGYPNNFLSSVGFGTNITITKNSSAQIGVGFPLGQRYFNEESARLYFSVNAEVDKIFLKPKERL